MSAQITNALGAVAASAAQHAGGKPGAASNGAGAGAGSTAARAAPTDGAAGAPAAPSAVPLGAGQVGGADAGAAAAAGRTLELKPPPHLGGKVGSITLRMVQIRPGATPGQVVAGAPLLEGRAAVVAAAAGRVGRAGCRPHRSSAGQCQR